MVLLKGLSDKGFVFYTNFNSKKGGELKENQKASLCFHWKNNSFVYPGDKLVGHQQ